MVQSSLLSYTKEEKGDESLVEKTRESACFTLTINLMVSIDIQPGAKNVEAVCNRGGDVL